MQNPLGTRHSWSNQIAPLLAELGLLALAVGTAAGFIRLFNSWGFLSELAIPIVAPWLLALTLRRLHINLFASLAAQVLAACILLTAIFAPGSSTLWLPTPATARLLSANISDSFAAFSQLVAPVPSTPGFLFIIAVGFWLFVAFADAAAFRYDGPTQAAIPFFTTFLALGILSRDTARVGSTIYFLAGLLLYTSSQLALRASKTRWDGLPQRSATRSVACSALIIGSGALLGGSVLGPLLPGSTEAVINLRKLGKGSEPRTVVSPFVGIRSLLGERSNTELFTVRSNEAAYWRLTALEEFDPIRDIWISRGTYQRSSGELPSNLGPNVSGSTLSQEIQISGLTGLWLPGAYQPSRITSDTEVSFDRESSSIILVSTDAKARPSYKLDSLIADFSAAAQAQVGNSEKIDPVYLTQSQSPAITPELLGEITAEASTPFERALALQNWFRNEFRYDETVDFSQSADPIADFLQAEAGFCQQFSSTFALFARALGLPSRVGVGFTPGDPLQSTSEPADSGATSTKYSVRGRHAHAWPEIYFAGVGWVPFEPTPGRGDPQGTPYTGVAAAQALPPATDEVTTTLLGEGSNNTATTAPPNASSSQTAPTRTDSGPNTGTSPTETSPTSPGTVVRFALLALLSTGVLLAALVGAALVRKQIKRRRAVQQLRAKHGEERAVVDAALVEDSWNRSLLWLALIGIRPEVSETPIEFASRASAAMSAIEVSSESPESDHAAVSALAKLETARRYGSLGNCSGQGIAAQAAADSVEQLIRYSSSGRRSRSLAFVLASLK
ncbi:unannotated protein [freshwater metagenome]|uniref:Unannotated protein n=1 Tax=freshwater metagenome TaxID=449393 RepID=A0A6J6TXT9_9ZZZZ